MFWFVNSGIPQIKKCIKFKIFQIYKYSLHTIIQIAQYIAPNLILNNAVNKNKNKTVVIYNEFLTKMI